MSYTHDKNTKTYLSVIVPAYGESKRIGSTLESLDSFLKIQDYDYEIIVVNDGSTDDTLAVLEYFTKKVPNMKIVNYSKNRGKGYAVRCGMKEARGVYRLFMDADNSVDIREVKKFLRHAGNGADVVIGSIAFQKDARHSMWHRKVLSDMSKVLIRSVTALGVFDTQRGFKLFSEKAAHTIFSMQTIERWGFDIELLVIAKTNEFKIKELQVSWNNTGESKVQLVHYVKTLFELGKIVKNRLLGIYQRDSSVYSMIEDHSIQQVPVEVDSPLSELQHQR